MKFFVRFIYKSHFMTGNARITRNKYDIPTLFIFYFVLDIATA